MELAQAIEDRTFLAFQKSFIAYAAFFSPQGLIKLADYHNR
jgi:hypothetical protein